MSDRRRGDREQGLIDRALLLITRRPTTLEQRLTLIRDLCLLKGINPRTGQERRLDTLTGARLNAAIIKLAVSTDEPPQPEGRPTFGLEPGPKTNLYDLEDTGLAQLFWDVADDPDIAAWRRQEATECDYVAARLGFNVETERRRIENLNDRHKAWLESITGKTEVITDDKRRHPAVFNQVDAIDVIGSEVGLRIRGRRNRRNDLLEATDKRDRRGKTYRPNKAGPCRTLTGGDLIEAIATLRPGKNQTEHYPRGNEKCLFDACRNPDERGSPEE